MVMPIETAKVPVFVDITHMHVAVNAASMSHYII